MNRFAAAAVLSLMMTVPAASQTPEQVRAVLETTPLIDGHNDLPGPCASGSPRMFTGWI